MGALLDATLCYCTGDTVGEVCRMALEHSVSAHVGNFCTACKDDLKLLLRAVREDPACGEREDLLLRAIQRASG